MSFKNVDIGRFLYIRSSVLAARPFRSICFLESI